MKSIFLSAFLFISTNTMAEVAPRFRPVGEFLYSGEVILNSKRTAETVAHTTPAGQARMKILKSDGFICVRKNQQASICQKTEKNLQTPDFIQKAVDDYLEKARFTFAGTGEPKIVHDGASTEWIIYETVMLGNKKVEMYKIVKSNDGSWYASFPVSSEQGIGTMEINSDSRMSLPLTLQGNSNSQTISYFITAGFKR